MTPKEKAQELVGKCFDAFINDEEEHHVETAWRLSKQCALITVGEVLEQLNHLPTEGYGMEYQSIIDYRKEVKQEIEKL
jgi:hypothetical protein